MLAVQQMLVPVGKLNRPQNAMTPKYITIHNTDNYDKGAGALAHANFIRSTSDSTSWHYSVDDKNIIQHIPINENAWHAGDGRYGTGNRESIGIEICVNPECDQTIAEKNAAQLIGKLYKEVPTLIAFPDGVVQHNNWTGKDCPHEIRSRQNGWQNFLTVVKKEMIAVEEWKLKIVEDAKKAGLIKQDHDPNEDVDAWFLLGVMLNMMQMLKDKGVL